MRLTPAPPAAASAFEHDLPEIRVRLQVASAEACHFWAAVLLAPFIGVGAVAGRWSVVAGFLVTQLLVNLYPILHLRSVRGRLDRTIERQSAARSARQPAR
jgi:hypothetical protein